VYNAGLYAALLLVVGTPAIAQEIAIDLRFGDGSHEITLDPGDNTTIELWATLDAGASLVTAETSYRTAETANEYGSVVPGFTVLGKTHHSKFFDISSQPVPADSVELGAYGSLLLGSLVSDGQPALLESYSISCAGPGDVEISLLLDDLDRVTAYNSGSFDYDFTGVAPILVHQTPEPTTLVLVAVGGLAIGRRRR
jgi:hypothetical protein